MNDRTLRMLIKQNFELQKNEEEEEDKRGRRTPLTCFKCSHKEM